MMKKDGGEVKGIVLSLVYSPNRGTSDLRESKDNRGSFTLGQGIPFSLPESSPNASNVGDSVRRLRVSCERPRLSTGRAAILVSTSLLPGSACLKDRRKTSGTTNSRYHACNYKRKAVQ